MTSRTAVMPSPFRSTTYSLRPFGRVTSLGTGASNCFRGGSAGWRARASSPFTGMRGGGGGDGFGAEAGAAGGAGGGVAGFSGGGGVVAQAAARDSAAATRALRAGLIGSLLPAWRRHRRAALAPGGPRRPAGPDPGTSGPSGPRTSG